MITTRRAAFLATIIGPRKWTRAPSTRRRTAASRRGSPSASPGGRSSVRNGGASRAVGLLLAGATPATALEQMPRREYEEATGRQKQAPAIPSELRDMVAEATPDRLVVRGLGGQLIPVSLDWIEPIDFASYREGRYLGFAITGYEVGGYTIVDRRSAGEAAAIETGIAPVFSPDGRFFAAAEMSGAAFGNLNGVALWEVLADRTVQRLFTDALPRGFDRRVDGWVRPDCVAISAIETGRQPAEGQEWDAAVRNAPRGSYAREGGDGSVASPPYDPAPGGAGETPGRLRGAGKESWLSQSEPGKEPLSLRGRCPTPSGRPATARPRSRSSPTAAPFSTPGMRTRPRSASPSTSILSRSSRKP